MSESVSTIKPGIVSAYLVGAEGGFVLIDTGLASQWEKLEGKLQAEGCLPGKLKLVAITHGDFDHTGLCRRRERHTEIKTLGGR
jgi:glyoxylase-like metal-dependent hydrolase (beta-lactamase superfamily II)